MWVEDLASSLRPGASVSSSEAIWSMKAPVPPAQVPFMRCSMPLSKKMILASSPPSSIAQSVWGMRTSTARLEAMTSCTNSRSSHWASSMPPEPVMDTRIGTSPTVSRALAKSARAVALTSVWWRS